MRYFTRYRRRVFRSGLFATYLFATHTLSRPDLFAAYTFATRPVRYLTFSLHVLFATRILIQNKRYVYSPDSDTDMRWADCKGLFGSSSNRFTYYFLVTRLTSMCFDSFWNNVMQNNDRQERYVCLYLTLMWGSYKTVFDTLNVNPRAEGVNGVPLKSVISKI